MNDDAKSSIYVAVKDIAEALERHDLWEIFDSPTREVDAYGK